MNQEIKKAITMIKDIKNIVPIALIIAGCIIGGAVIYASQNKCEENTVNTVPILEATGKAMEFINDNMLQEGMEASLLDAVEENGLYKMNLDIGGDEYESYITKDGEVFFVQGFKIKPEEPDISKADIPDVKLFVMSYCPFGLQAQKALLPAYDLLKDKADIGVYFVSYIMHDKKEIDENLKQYCIQEEQNEKFYDYLSCFVIAGDSEGCLNSAGIDVNQMKACMTATDQEYKITEKYNDSTTWLNGRYPLFDVHKDLNQQYEVTGSPVLVINGKVLTISSRSPEEYKKAICEAFNTAPEECSQILSTDVASPNFGGGTGSSSGGSCN